MSYKVLKNNLESLLLSHPEVNNVNAGFEDQREEWITKIKEFPCAWISEPKGGGGLNSRFIRVELIITDRLLDGRENEVDVISDLTNTMEDIKEMLINSSTELFTLSNFAYSFTRGNTTGEETVDVRAFFDFDFVNVGACEI